MQERPTIAEQLVPALDALESSIADAHWRVVPSSFAPDDPHLRALPLPADWQWPSLASVLAALGVRTLILQQPAFWQVEPLAFHAARQSSIPICSIEPENYPLDRAAVRYAGADGVLAGAAEAGAIAGSLHASDAALVRAWVLIHSADAPQWDTPAALLRPDAKVAHEVHLAPGVPLLTQCAHLAQGSAPRFHRSGIFQWGGTLAAPTITADSLPCAITRLALPFALEERGACECGERVVSRA